MAIRCGRRGSGSAAWPTGPGVPGRPRRPLWASRWTKPAPRSPPKRLSPARSLTAATISNRNWVAARWCARCCRSAPCPLRRETADMPRDAAELFGRPTPRIDGVAKVTGAARYASDEPVANPAFAYLVTSAIARGRVGGFRLERAKAVAGVVDILTHDNVGTQARP